MSSEQRKDADVIARREGIGAKHVLLIASALLLIVFFVVNSQKVEVHLLFATVDLPLIVALLIAALLGALVGWATPRTPPLAGIAHFTSFEPKGVPTRRRRGPAGDAAAAPGWASSG